MPLSANFRGALLMAGSMAGFVLNDTVMKYGGTEIGVFQAIFVRGLFVIVIMGMMAWYAGAFRAWPATRERRLIGWRTLAEIGATLTFLTALFNMPLATVTAILQLTPLVISVAAFLIFGERISAARAFAIAVGLIGVLLILCPGADGFQVFSLFALVAVGFATWRDLTVRKLSVSVPSLLVAWIAAVGITLAGGVGVGVGGLWTPLDLRDVTLLGVSACFLMIAYYCAVAAMRYGDVAFVSPFRYTVLVWAIALGWLVFGDWPDAWALVGMGILILAGLVSVLAEGASVWRKGASQWS